MLRVGHLSCFDLGTFEASSWAPTFDASSWAPLMPRVGHLSCFELGAFDASTWAPLMPGVGHLACLELGFLDASSWTPLMPGVSFLPAVGHLMHQSILLFSLELGTSDASGVAFLSNWAPAMLPLPLRHLELGTCPASSWASLMPGVGHLSCLELGASHDASSWAPLMLRLGHL